jgi:hypothetical protein
MALYQNHNVTNGRCIHSILQGASQWNFFINNFADEEVGLTTSPFRRRGRTGRILREKASRHISHVLEKRFRQKRVPAKGILRRRARGVLRKGPLRRGSFMSDLAFGASGPERRAGHSTFKPPPCTMVCKQLPSIETDVRQHNIQPRTAILAAFAPSDAMAGAPNPSNTCAPQCPPTHGRQPS